MRFQIIIKNGSYVHNRLLPELRETVCVKQALRALVAAVMLVVATGILPAGAERAKNFSIHTASYKTEKGALSDVRALRSKGYDAYFRKVAIPGKGVWYRVYVGSYESREKAAKTAEAMKKGGQSAYVSIESRQKPPAKGGADESVKGKKTQAKPAPAKKAVEKKEPAAPKPVNSTESQKKAPAAVTGKAVPSTTGAPSPPPEKKQNVESKPNAATVSPSPQPLQATVPVAAPAAPTGNPAYDEAMRDFEAGQYEKAANSLKKLHGVKQADPVIRENVLRRLADAFFFLGEKRGRQDYFSASDYYKQILNDYPDPRSGNDVVYDRLSKCHENLRFYYEALQALDKLIARYPGSPYHGDAMFRSGEVLNKSGKMDKAVEKYVMYVRQYPDGTHARMASYILGDCYYRLGQSENAETWFSFARKKWPELSELPKYMMIDLGYHNYRYRKFSEAVDIFSQYVSLYPADEWTKSVMMAMGRSLAEMHQEATALKVFSKIMERYPDSRESIEAAVAMAAIGVDRPGLSVPLYMVGVDNYQNPIISYGLLLRKYPESDLVELILNQKGLALSKIGNHREAVDTSLELLRRYPKGAYQAEAVRTFKANALKLVNEGYGKGDFVAVSDLYYRVASHGIVREMDFDTLFKIGDSLKMIGLNSDALSVFNDLSKMSTTLDNETRTIIAMAEIEKMQGRDKEAEQKLLGIINQPKQKDSAAYRTARAILADIMYKRGSYDSAIQSYREALMKSGGKGETLSAYENYADALKAKDMCSQAANNYQKVIDAAARDGEKYPPAMIAGAYMGLGDCLFKEKRFDEGMAMYEQGMKYVTADDRKMWSVYRMAQEAMKASNYPLAEKSFAQLKASSDSAFWTKISEYTIESGKWSEKHAEYLKRR